jgi:hypothetical protein
MWVCVWGFCNVWGFFLFVLFFCTVSFMYIYSYLFCLFSVRTLPPSDNSIADNNNNNNNKLSITTFFVIISIIKHRDFWKKLAKIFHCVIQIIWGKKCAITSRYIGRCCTVIFYCGNEYGINFLFASVTITSNVCKELKFSYWTPGD